MPPLDDTLMSVWDEAHVAKSCVSTVKEARVAKLRVSTVNEARVAKLRVSTVNEARVAKLRVSTVKEAHVADTPMPAIDEAQLDDILMHAGDEAQVDDIPTHVVDQAHVDDLPTPAVDEAHVDNQQPQLDDQPTDDLNHENNDPMDATATLNDTIIISDDEDDITNNETTRQATAVETASLKNEANNLVAPATKSQTAATVMLEKIKKDTKFIVNEGIGSYCTSKLFNIINGSTNNPLEIHLFTIGHLNSNRFHQLINQVDDSGRRIKHERFIQQIRLVCHTSH